MSDRDFSRRDFLKLAQAAILAACGALGLAGLVRFLDTRSDPVPQTDFDLGPAAVFPPGWHVFRPEIPAYISRSETGFTALSLVCTHLGCTVEEQGGGWKCPCHGSRFTLDGRLVRGPAAQSLRSLRTEVASDGNLHVYTN